jgi:uncharacterized protein
MNHSSQVRHGLLGTVLVLALVLAGAIPAAANSTPQAMPFAQSWADIGLITVNDDWTAVPGVVGFLGQDITTATGTDPQTLLGETPTVLADIDAIANQTNPNTLATGGVAEFHLTDPVVALQGSGTADAPYLLLHLNTTGSSNISVAYNLRDIDGSADNAIQPVALQYRVGSTGNFTNLPAGFVADATTGPSIATLVTPVNVTLPAAANDQPLIQVRIITANAVGSDEWVGVDDIMATASSADIAPTVQLTAPTNGATGVAVDTTLSVTFSEPVNLSGDWFSIDCTTSGLHPAVVAGGPDTFSLDPDLDFVNGESCTLTVTASGVSDQDTNDPPDNMESDAVITFTAAALVALPTLVINEIDYDQPSTDAAEFLEIKNVGTTPTSLNGVSVVFVNGVGPAVYLTAALPNLTLAAGDYFVVCANALTTQNCDIDITPDTNLIQNGAPDAVALTFTSAVVDTVSYEGDTGAPYTEGSGTGLVDDGVGAADSISRCSDGSDTNQNNVDFLLRPSTPGSVNGCPGDDLAPTVASTSPVNGALGAALDGNISVTFSEPVDVVGTWFTIACASSGPHTATVTGGPTTFTLDPSPNFVANESCSVSLLAAGVTDQDLSDPPNQMSSDYLFAFQTADVLVCGAPATPIHDVQGSGLVSPLVGTGVEVEGVVVGDYQTAAEFRGFNLEQEAADWDADPSTSEGVFVFDDSFGVDVSPGDVVRVRGTAIEFFGLTEISSVNAVQVCATGVSVDAVAVSLPVASLSDHERYEGMLVDYDQTLTATEVFSLGRFGEVSLSGVGRLYTPTAVTTPGAAAIARLDQNNRSRIILDDGNSQQNIDPTRYPQGGLSALNTLRVGDTLPGLTGVMDFRFSNYRIQPVGPINFDPTNPRTAAPADVGGNLKVASFNVLNFFNGDGSGVDGAAGGFPTARGADTLFELGRQTAKIVSAITAIDADVVGLMEIENDATPNSAIEALVAALNTAAGPGTYAFVDTGVIGTDQIRVALIYKPDVVAPVGSFAIITSATDPRFIDTLNRPSLAQTFERAANGARLTVVVNHLKSKGSDCNAVGDPDLGDGQGNCNLTRTNAAAALADWIATDPTGSGDPDYLIIGDLNSYRFEDPIETLLGAGFTNLVAEFGGDTPYSYVFNGESGYLDHALASASLATQATGTTDWHINPDEPTVLDYNVEFKSANHVNTLFDTGPYRASDHDPVVIGLNLIAAPSVQAGGPYSVGEGGSVSVTATGSDPDGDTLAYAWDLDDNGTFESPGASVTFSAAAIDGPATRTISVRVTDASGLTSASSAEVEVTNVAPSGTLNAPLSVFAGSSFTLSLTAPTDPGVADTAAGFSYAFDCGGGGGYGVFGAANVATCPTSLTGVRSVGGKIRDKDGGITEYTATVAVIVTYDSLCSLTRTLVTKIGIANALCDKLDHAEAAASIGNTGLRDAYLRDYRKQLDSQTGKSVTATNAALLKTLSLALV